MIKTIMIIEDNEMNMKLFNDLLQAQGYRTIQLLNGKTALKMALGDHPDLVLMDIQLPDVSGLEITKQFKDHKKLKTIPIIAITAHAMRGDREKILESGFNDYIAKPISIETFLIIIAKNLP